MEIRRITPNEAHLIVPHVLHVQDLHAQAQPMRYTKDPAPETVRVWLHDMLTRDTVIPLIASIDGTIAGYLIAVLEPPAPTPFTHADPSLKIDQICVLPAYQNNGIATALIQTALDIAKSKGITKASVSYGSFNAKSAALMTRMGFAPVNIKAERYESP